MATMSLPVSPSGLGECRISEDTILPESFVLYLSVFVEEEAGRCTEGKAR